MRIVGALILLFGALLFAALTLPYWFDANSHRQDFAQALESVLGRRVTISGPIRVNLLPSPTLSAERIAVPAPSGGRAVNLFEADRIDLSVGLSALITGAIEAEKVGLQAPRLYLEILRDGTPNWLSPPVARETGLRPARLRLDNIGIVNGRIDVLGRNNDPAWRIEGIVGQGRADSVTGPFAFRGQARFGSLAARVDLSLGRADGSDLPTTVIVDLGPGLANLRYVGAVDTWREKPTWRGAVELSVPDPAKFDPRWAGAVTLAGQFEGTPARLALTEVRLGWGEVQAQGGLAIDLGSAPRFDLTMRANQLDLDRMGERLAKAGGFGGLMGALIDPPVSPWLAAGTFQLETQAAYTAAGVARQLVVAGQVADGAVSLDRAEALLPGGTAMNLNGRLSGGGAAARFDGRLDMSSDNLRQFLAWAGLDARTLPGDRLRAAWFKSKIALTDEVIELADFSFGVDVTTGQGAAAAALRRRPSFSLDLSLDRVALDAYWPDGGWRLSPAWLGAFDTNIKLQADRVDWFETPIAIVDLDAALLDGKLALRRVAAADLAGAGLGLSGEIAVAGNGVRYDLVAQGLGPEYGRVERALGGDAGPLARPVRGPFTLAAAANGQAPDGWAALTALARAAVVDVKSPPKPDLVDPPADAVPAAPSLPK